MDQSYFDADGFNHFLADFRVSKLSGAAVRLLVEKRDPQAAGGRRCVDTERRSSWKVGGWQVVVG